MKTFTVCVTGIVLSLLCLANFHAMPGAQALAAEPPTKMSAKTDVLHDAMRQLWADHVAWTRLYIISATADLPDTEAVTQRLIQNQTDIGNAIRPYYGDAGATKLTSLLKDHIIIAAEVVAAAKKNDAAALVDGNKRWADNANAIAALLNSANPDNWSESAIKGMLRNHLDLTTDELKARLAGDWKADIAAYEKVQTQAMEMADAFSAGIVAQFPDKF